MKYFLGNWAIIKFVLTDFFPEPDLNFGDSSQDDLLCSVSVLNNFVLKQGETSLHSL